MTVTDDRATSDAATGEQTHYRTCPLCEASCGLELTVRDGAVVPVKPLRVHGRTRGQATGGR